ncbi:MAG TPA: hypothetical protein VE954_42885 [Oligoflexus sp.]|uniref:hypothetical protein n=1 Tax=Oligoflexus sp. TaxID=1971216 RepID=UPI002D4AF748|nr:hypothetical protein [Oligoflexus sp.]HYX39889.1 hypothetical protein [Oligoflexus sp.]
MDINPSRPEQQQSSERPLNLSDFAQRNQITEDRVWELIEEGELAARFVNDEILILREQEPELDASVELSDAALHLEVGRGEPQIEFSAGPAWDMDAKSEISPTEPVAARARDPMAAPAREPVAAREPTTFTAREPVIPNTRESVTFTAREPVIANTREPAAFTARPGAAMDRQEDPAPRMTHEAEATHDHPELPVEDYRDLLLFAQDAMNRTMDLSRQLLGTKDELIRMKDERIQHLQAELQKNEQEIRRLKKNVEDLETLCRLTPNL